jgi:hypothetical protein
MIVVAIAMVAYGAITDQLWWALLAIGPIAAAAEGNDLWVRCPLCDRHTPTRRGLALVFASHTRMRDNGDNELVCTHCDRGVALSNGRSWLD